MPRLRKLKTFSEKALRRDFYPTFVKMMNAGFETEAYLMMLSIWNFARFRYAVKTFKIDHFEKIIQQVRPLFLKLEREDFGSMDLKKYESEIKTIFRKLSAIKGVEKTGASKMMHLRLPKVFVMWDTFIRNHYKYRKGDADDYLNFLIQMQNNFRDIAVPRGRTLAKVIDEHNYRTFTEPALKNFKKKTD